MPYNDVINTGLEIASNFDPSDGNIDGTFLENLLTPGVVQQREFGQQVALQQMQNDWNSEQNKMKRLKEAGVNPLTAAQGVSGSGQSPATSAVPGQAVTTPLSNLGDAISGIGQGVESISKAKETRKLLENRNKNLVTDTFLKLKEAGYQDALAKNLSIATMFLPQEKMLNLMAMAAEVPKIAAEYKSIMQGIEESKERIKEIGARIELAKSTGNYQDKLALEAEKRALQIQVQTDMDNWRYDKMKRLNLDPNNPIENNMFTMACEGNQDLVDKGASVFRDIEYNKSTGAYEAEADWIEQIARSRRNGENASDVFYGRVGSWADAIGRAGKLLFGGYVDGVIPNLTSSSSPNEYRQAIMILIQKASSELGKDENKDIELGQLISQLNGALLLSDKELKDWYSKNVK